jgi:hypothetical protein
MPPFLLWLFEQVGFALLKRWWSGGKPAEQQEAENALSAKTREAEALAAPPRDKSAIVDSMRSRTEH